MVAKDLNHVTIPARNLQESVDFYADVFGIASIPSPNFGTPVKFLRVGDRQLHLFTSDRTPHEVQHLGMVVDDFERFYWDAAERGILASNALGLQISRWPSGVVQMYVRDPAGNLVEVACESSELLSPRLMAKVQELSRLHPQNRTNQGATLFLTRSR